MVTGVREGSTTVTLSYTSPDSATTLIATHDVTVTSPTAATNSALFYYLNNPNGSLDSTSTTQWTSLGSGSVNLTGLDSSNFPNDNGETAIFDRVSDRVITWPDDSTGDEYQVARGSSDWNNIFKAYKSVIEGMLPGVTVTDEDVESICVKPYKLTNNNDGYHVDCSVSITCRNLFNARYYVDDPTTPGEGFQLIASKLTYREGDTTDIADFADVSLRPSKTVGGIEYTFNGWYTDQALTQQVELPYTIDGNVNFYAKYLSGRQVIYDLAGGSWNNSDALVHAAQEGSTQTVKAEPTRVGHEFAGWTVAGLDGVTTLESGVSFTMPDNNVTFTATWNELSSCKVKYVERGTGAEIATADTLYGHAGDVVTATAKGNIEGYHLVDPMQTSATATLVQGETPEIIFYYEKDSASYQVNYYLNGTEQKVADSDTFAASWGTEVSAADLAKSIDGYTAVPGQTATAIVERDGTATIDVYYYQNATLTANSATKDYTGEAQRVEGYTCDIEGAVFAGITLEGGKGTEAGTYPYTFAPGTAGAVSTDGKYIVAKANDGKLMISANSQQIVVKIKGNTGGGKYDGTEHGVEGYTVSYVVGGVASADAPAGFDAGDISFAGTAKVTGTDAGSYPMGLKAGDFSYAGKNFSNVSFEVEDGELSILPATLTVTTHGASKPYDGTALTAPGEISGFVNGETASFAVIGSQTLAGTSVNSYAIAWDGTAKESNYSVVEGAIGTLEVTLSQVAITVTPRDGSKVYDGKPLTSAGIDVDNLPAGFTLEAATKGSITDAGELLAEIDAPTIVIKNAAGEDVTAQFANVTCGKAPLIVIKRPVTVTSATDSKVYDGVALTKHEATVTAGSLVEGESFGYDFTGAQTAVGTSDNSFTVKAGANTSLDNYEITQVNGTLTVIAYTPPAPGPGTDEPTPGPGKNPSTPNGPTNSSDVTPPGSTTSDDMGSVPTASDSKETTMPKSADKATSGNNAQSEGKQSPDNASGAEQPTSCWVHWFMILGTIATLVYGAIVSLRRRRMVADLDNEMSDVIIGAKEGSGK